LDERRLLELAAKYMCQVDIQDSYYNVQQTWNLKLN